MKIVIDIPEEVYKCVMDGTYCGTLYDELKNGVLCEPCVDFVSRESVNKLVDELARAISDEKSHIQRGRYYGIIMRDILDLPSVEPERKTGHWEWDQRAGEYVCSECGCNPIYERTTPDCSEIDKYRFCRWCGEKMEVEADHS